MIKKPFIYSVFFLKNKIYLQKSIWKESKWLCSSSVSKAKKIMSKAEVQYLLKKKSMPTLEVWWPMTIKDACNVFKIDKDLISLLFPDSNHKNELDMHEVNAIAKKLHKKCIFIKNPYILSNKTTKKPNVFKQPPPKPENLVKRPPVVTVMGHVDHGKTTLLDSLRNTFVVDKEFGGITQHIGAFSVQVKPGDKITFIDTPGHAAFTTMRARGAEVTDLVVLVIAADDGVMEQTIESIKIVKKAQVKMLVAVNKIDKPKAMSIDLIKDKLLEHGIQVEDKGGDVQLVPISALKKINLDLLIEMILAEAEIMNLTADPKGLVEGVVIESKTHNQGPVATIIVKRGTLKKGQILVAGTTYAKVRSLKDENGNDYNEVFPSTPVQIFGWKSLPEAGENIFQVESEKQASLINKDFKRTEVSKKQEKDSAIIAEKAAREHEIIRNANLHYKTLTSTSEKKKFFAEKLLEQRKKVENTEPTLNIVVKGDVHGTVEVLMEILASYDSNDECKLSIVEASVGDVVQKDLQFSELFNAIIYAFNVNIHSSIINLVKEKNIDIRMHNVIYKLVDDLRSELTSRLLPKNEEKIIGEAYVNEQFLISVKKKKIPVAGCKCVKGELVKNSLYKVIRDEEVIYEGKLVSMKHHKNEVNSIKSNVECGLMFESFDKEFKPQDKIICYEIIQVPQQTSWDPGF